MTNEDPPVDPADHPTGVPPDTQTQRLLQIRREVARAADYMCLSCGATVYETDSLYMVLLPHEEPISRFTARDFGVRCLDCCPEQAQDPAMEIVPPDEHEETVYTARSPVGVAAVDPSLLSPIREVPDGDDPWTEVHELSEKGYIPVATVDPDVEDLEDRYSIVDERDRPDDVDPAAELADGVKPPGAPIDEVDGVQWVFDSVRQPSPDGTRDPTPPGEAERSAPTPDTPGSDGPRQGPRSGDSDPGRSLRGTLVATLGKLTVGTGFLWAAAATVAYVASALNFYGAMPSLPGPLPAVGAAMADAPLATAAWVALGAPAVVYAAHLLQRSYAYTDPFFPLATPTSWLDTLYERLPVVIGVGGVLLAVATAMAAGTLASIPSWVVRVGMALWTVGAGTVIYSRARTVFRSGVGRERVGGTRVGVVATRLGLGTRALAVLAATAMVLAPMPVPAVLFGVAVVGILLAGRGLE
jgi:hypothetical protein